MVSATPEVGTRLADRYRLLECIEKSDGFSTWQATDEKLARPVGIHILPSDAELTPAVLEAAQLAATVDDPRFLRVLDAVHREPYAYVVHEWLPDAHPLSTVLAHGPLDPDVAQTMIRDAAEALAAAHEAGLAHLRLQADTVLVLPSGHVKILGLCVEAALHSTTAGDPARSDARGLGRVLYAALTARWPEGEAFGLAAAPFEHGAICTPRQVRAGVPDAMDAIVDRLLNPTPRAGTPLRSPGELRDTLHQLPRPRPPGSGPSPDTTGTMSAVVTGILSPMPTPDGWKPSAATRGAQVAVIGMLVIGLVLLSWQLLRALAPESLGGQANTPEAAAPLVAIPITATRDFDPPPGNGSENPRQARLAVDDRPRTAWRTVAYNTRAFGGLKPGVGLVLDLGDARTVRQVKLRLPDEGASIEIRAAALTANSAPSALSAFRVAASTAAAAREETLRFASAVRTRFVLIWITQLPPGPGPTYRGGISEVSVSG
ncbi:protein kinase family protein [Sporichthya polymorpha]|uniref:protein kinase family protein n=1 Tax=Sporichthya polymorpha TaxID=35751 RepID=UPI0003771F3D|nr:protein kinase family protein [Sporichthya polymorpha]